MTLAQVEEAPPGAPGVSTPTVAILRGGAAALILRAVSMAGQFASNVLLAHYLGAGGAGAFFLALTSTLVASTLARLGMDTALLRFSAVTSDRREWSDTAALFRSSLAICTLASAATTIALIALAGPIARLGFHAVSLVVPLRVLAVGILPMSVSALTGEFLKGIDRVACGVLVETAGMPLLSIPAYVSIGAARGGVSLFCAAYVVVSAMIMVFGISISWMSIPRSARTGGHFDWIVLMSTSMPLLVTSLTSLVMNWSSVLILGIFESTRTVGIFALALRTAQLVAWPLAASNSVVAPRLAALFARHDLAGARQTVRIAMGVNAMVGVPVWLALVAGSGIVLRLFGPGFAAGRAALIVLATGQLVNVCMGPVGFVLTMSGHQATARNIYMVLTTASVALTVGLVRAGGLIGAAIATALTVVTWNLVAAIAAYRRTGVPVLAIYWRKGGPVR
ncbi:MAG: oligosaccharide flippase family protein [Mycobacteriales bacterium]